MKISFNTHFIEGPYGGGMQFAKYLKSYIENNQIQVINHLNDDDIDLILHINPFPFFMKSAVFTYQEAYSYKCKHPQTIIVQRINECDERKGTNYMNNLLIQVSNYSDYVIFIADWLKQLFEQQGMRKHNNSSVILNGADNKIFNTIGKVKTYNKKRLKIITHHWGANLKKGHKIYMQLDELLDKSEFKNLFEFTFVGNIPKGIKYKNTKIIAPLVGKKLAEELKTHDFYITASINEPAGMHHIEAALCGLPILYMNSGALPQYCNGYGIMFDENNFIEKLLEMYSNIEYWQNKITNYDNTAQKMAENYLNLFVSLIQNKHLYSFKEPCYLKAFFFSIYSKFNYVYQKIKYYNGIR